MLIIDYLQQEKVGDRYNQVSGKESPVPMPRPAPLYFIVPPISLNEFLDNVKPILDEYNATLKLPTWTPNGVKPIKVWFKWGSPIIGIIAYDHHDVKNYDECEIAIGVYIYLKYYPPPCVNMTKGIWEFLYEREKGNAQYWNECKTDVVDKAYFMIIDDMIVNAKIFKDGSYWIDVFDVYNGVVIRYDIGAGKHYNLSDLIKMIKSMKPVQK